MRLYFQLAVGTFLAWKNWKGRYDSKTERTRASECLQLDKRVILCPKLSPVVNLEK